MHWQDRVLITWDASPFGMGATLQVNGDFKEFFAIKITQDDERILETKAGTSDGQQVWECLTGLIALRVWAKYWHGCRAKLQIRSDNVGALTLMTTLRGRSKPMSIIAREYALDLGQAQWRPDLATHIPGLTNSICDVLSRRYDPNKSFSLPKLLHKARAIIPPPRDESWWKTRNVSMKKRSPTRSFEDVQVGSHFPNKQIKPLTMLR